MNNREVEWFNEMIRSEMPDIVSINEVDDWWVRKLEGFKDTYPYSLEKPLSGCGLIGDIFGAGFYTGIIVVVLVLALLGYLVYKMFKR